VGQRDRGLRTKRPSSLVETEEATGAARPAAVDLASAFGHGGGRGERQNGEEDDRDQFPISAWSTVAHEERSMATVSLWQGGTGATTWGAWERDRDGWGGVRQDKERRGGPFIGQRRGGKSSASSTCQ
jgi:hypothetical protein